LTKLSDAYHSTGDHRKALESAARGRDIAEQFVKENSGNEDGQRLLYESLRRIGSLHWNDRNLLDDRDPEGAKREYHRALQIAQKRGDDAWQQRVALIEIEIGYILRAQKDWEQSLKSHRKALAISEQLSAMNPESSDWKTYVGYAHRGIGYVLADQKRWEDALVEYGKALEIQEDLVHKHPQNRIYQLNLSYSYYPIGDVYKAKSNLDDALKQYRGALEIADNLAKYDADDLILQDLHALLYVAIANAHVDQRQFDAALREYDVASQIRIRVADIFKNESNFDDALKQYQRALDITNDLTTHDPDNVDWKIRSARLYTAIADAHVDQRQFDTALKEYDVALQIRIQLAGKSPDSRDRQRELAAEYERVGDAFKARGELLNAHDDLRTALEKYQTGLKIIEAFMQKDPTSGLEEARDNLRKNIQSLPSNIQ
jgi:tetratricopeptide (TPR) repeat protein